MTAELNKKDRMREIVAQRLKSVAASELSNLPAGAHVDEDLIAAFVEGRLTDTECKPVLSHLAACGLCRRTSAQFVQLENQIDVDIVTPRMKSQADWKHCSQDYGPRFPASAMKLCLLTRTLKRPERRKNLITRRTSRTVTE